MKTRFLLIVIPALMLTFARADEPLGVNTVFEKNVEFVGKEITVTGLVERVSASRHMVVLIDTTEATCTDACDRKTLVVLLPKTANLPSKGSFLTVNGTLIPDANPPQLTAVSVESTAP